jgi:hypothetical protein
MEKQVWLLYLEHFTRFSLNVFDLNFQLLVMQILSKKERIFISNHVKSQVLYAFYLGLKGLKKYSC